MTEYKNYDHTSNDKCIAIGMTKEDILECTKKAMELHLDKKIEKFSELMEFFEPKFNKRELAFMNSLITCDQKEEKQND